jgi:hypothetical protein
MTAPAQMIDDLLAATREMSDDELAAAAAQYRTLGHEQRVGDLGYEPGDPDVVGTVRVFAALAGLLDAERAERATQDGPGLGPVEVERLAAALAAMHDTGLEAAGYVLGRQVANMPPGAPRRFLDALAAAIRWQARERAAVLRATRRDVLAGVPAWWGDSLTGSAADEVGASAVDEASATRSGSDDPDGESGPEGYPESTQ